MRKNTDNQTRGVLEMTYEGYGFVIPEQKGVPDIFVPAHAIGDALHRDTVDVRVMQGRGGKLEGRILAISKRGVSQIVGRFEVRGKSAIVVTEDFRVGRTAVIPRGKEGGARHNEMVIALITEYPHGDRSMVAEVTKRLGVRGSDPTEVNLLKAKHGLPELFLENVLSDARAASRSFYKDRDLNRVDITHLPFITIDGEDAKDFDDAICAEKLNSSSYRVWVSIADVSHFVKEGSALDQEASKRATSVYLPGFCIPMLPEDLSTDVCSLLPGEDRYCMTAEMVIDNKGAVGKSKFYKSVIRSSYRMTYTEVNGFLALGEKIETEESVLKSLCCLNEAALFVRKGRVARGSLDFDLPEPEIFLDLTGKPENIVKAERNIAHMLVEDLMIAANEAVATFLTMRQYPCLYRVHDRPDPEKLTELKVLLNYLGHKVSFGQDPSPMKISKVVRLVRGKPEERLINMMLLRSMSQAVYSLENIGHFGLASKCYCHFTSPIRRYPDLLVHRLLSDALKITQFKKGRSIKYLKGEAENSSKMERKSMEAERESIKLYSAIFMRDKIGEIFDGLISHTAKKGIFIELKDYFIEGILLPDDLLDDQYRFDPKKFAYVGKKSGKSIHIGDPIQVRVKDVSVEQRLIYFEPTE